MARKSAADKAKAAASGEGGNTNTPPSIPPETKQELDSVTLAAPYGFFDDDEVHHFWNAGTEVKDADTIALLMQRKAPLVGITHGE